MYRLLVALLLTPVLLTGCANQKNLVAQQARTIDSLYVAERAMRAELYALQDSIQYYDDIDSGLYYRQERALNDRINKLEYLLTVRRDTLCLPEPVETLLVDDLFKPASAELSEAGLDTLAALATHLDSTYARHRFRVEGHADNTPVGGQLLEKYPSNWELSAARAAAVVRFFTDELNFDAARFEVVAFGDARPAAPNNTARGRRQNRRIQIQVLPL
jgi:chemotaxis protein MotB